jgi:deazaflavin-dependent oxidoreductase (nitroreductase family)
MTAANDQNQRIIDEFRANGGKVGGYFAGMPLLLLSTTGAKSGKQTVSPVACTPDGDRLLVYASAAGRPNHPAWYHNLVANPAVTVEYGTARFAARATVITGAARDRLWDAQVARAPGFGDYQRTTTRVIPVVALERA